MKKLEVLPGVKINMADDSVIVTSEYNKMIYILNDAEGEIIRLISENADYSSILSRLESEYIADDGVIKRDLDVFITELINARIVKWES